MAENELVLFEQKSLVVMQELKKRDDFTEMPTSQKVALLWQLP